RPARRQDLAATIDERLDDRIADPLVLRLHVVDTSLVLDVGVEAGDHGRDLRWTPGDRQAAGRPAEGSGRGRPSERARRRTRRCARRTVSGAWVRRRRGTRPMAKRAAEGTAVVLCEGMFGGTGGKTAHGLVRHTERYRVRAVIDSRLAGRDAGEVLDGAPAG